MTTPIEWAEETWNPVTGCDKVSAGCKNCYAEKMALRLQGMGQPNYSNGFEVTIQRHMLKVPFNRKKATRYFVGSMGDVFHKDVPFAFIDKIMAVCALCPQHQMMFLTKRADRMLEYFSSDRDILKAWQIYMCSMLPLNERDLLSNWPLPNVWPGVSIENQPTADERIPLLLQIPAAKRFVSYEPALGPVDFTKCEYISSKEMGDLVAGVACNVNYLKQRNGIDLVIMGGESGPGARPMHPDWPKKVRDDCVVTDVPFFFKQWGAYVPANPFTTSRRGKFLMSTEEMKDLRWITKSGKIMEITAEFHRDKYEGEYPLTPMKKVGKKAAGDLLDGRQYHEWPL